MEILKQHYLYGMHPILEALRTDKKIDKILIKKGLEGAQFDELMELVKAKDVQVQFVPIERLTRVTKGSHQGVVAVLSLVEHLLLEEMIDKALAKSDSPIFVILDGVSDVRNFGAIARSVECLGADGIILPAKGGARINSDAIKTSSGALLRLDTAKPQNLKIAIFQLKEKGFKIIGASEKASEILYHADLKGPIAIVIGSEDKGISPSVIKECDELLQIPLKGEIGSLNVSVATSIVLYEALKQRKS
ncbi:MAG: 23S rRNA (guanosine(2251)-2'-O)-methyltransferase RlmB [Bacteroidales bacterium]